MEESVFIIGRRPGRPRSTEQKSSVTSWIPSEVHDRIVAAAGSDRSVSQVIAEVLVRNFPTDLPKRRC